MKLDPEVRNIKPEAAVAVAKALELFLAFMAVRVGHIASTHKRRTVKRTDVLELIHRNATTSFLKGVSVETCNSFLSQWAIFIVSYVFIAIDMTRISHWNPKSTKQRKRERCKFILISLIFVCSESWITCGYGV
jgi:hypothetical protein